jgi:4-hydroxy-4-methyl-2-oxoglutarate aldolase
MSCCRERIAPVGRITDHGSEGARQCRLRYRWPVRDIKRIRAMQFPVFHGGIAPLDAKGRAEIYARDVPVECGASE